MKKYDVAVFDVDGTLLDTTEGVLASVLYTIEKYGLKPLERDTLLKFIGPPIQDSFAKAYHLEGAIIQELAETFRMNYKTENLFKARPYEGIYEVFEILKSRGVKLAVATYKRQDYATEILKHFGFDKYTNILYGSDNNNKLKKQDIIEKCLVDLGVENYSNTVMVGDSDNDAIGANAIGMSFLGVTYGFGFRSEEDVNKFASIGCTDSASQIVEFF